MREVTCRQFLQGAVGGGGALGLATFGFDATAAAQEVRELKIQNATETRTVCPYCAVGCSMIGYTIGGDAANTQPVLVHIEGDPGSASSTRCTGDRAARSGSGSPGTTLSSG
jgi:formate dehydrogenase major subunit